jgi:hypothetical protein
LFHIVSQFTELLKKNAQHWNKFNNRFMNKTFISADKEGPNRDHEAVFLLQKYIVLLVVVAVVVVNVSEGFLEGPYRIVQILLFCVRLIRIQIQNVEL